MKASELISPDFVILPGRLEVGRARDIILSSSSLSHAIVAPYASFHEVEPATKIPAGDVLVDIRRNIELTNLPWSKLQLSPSKRLYVVRRDKFIDLDDEERQNLLRILIERRDWTPADLIGPNSSLIPLSVFRVVLEKDQLAGVVDPQVAVERFRRRAVEIKTGATESISSDMESRQPPSDIPPEGNGGRKPPPGDFNAFPRLDAPVKLEPEQEFAVAVGYRPDPDPTLARSTPLHIDTPPANATIRLSVSAFGARILEQSAQELPLNIDAEANIRCVVEPNAKKVTLFADYFYNWQLIGNATREIAVTMPESAAASLAIPKDDAARFNTPTDASAVDMTVLITKLNENELEWKIYGPCLSKAIETRYPISGARDFAWKILSELNVTKKGKAAKSIIDNHSDSISDTMPDQFFEALREVHKAVKRRPIILIHTDEMYVPWELAAVKPPLNEIYGPSYLGAQAVVGRWLRHRKVPKPPPHDVQLRTVLIFASDYGKSASLARLPQALKEQQNLKVNLPAYGLEAETYEATFENIEQLLDQERKRGTAIHFAVHGHRRIQPGASEEHLVFADGRPISPSMLAGGREDDPRFDLVFINACQIGTAAESLGQAAGFPGALIKAGAKAFLAPLWNVHDTTARSIAEAFYEQTLQDGVSVAEFLSERRRLYEPKGTTTPLAYIFYGHPRLRVRKFDAGI
jgi:hypothetical protein